MILALVLLGMVALPVIEVEANPGIIYEPDDYGTIQEAVDNASSGDTIVHDGTYTENVNVGVHNLTTQSENGMANCIVQAADSEPGTFAPLGNFAASPVHNAAGWVVGDPSDGYGTILYTTDGGDTWERQGSIGEIPNVGFDGVSAVDSNTAWVAGGNKTCGVILYTTDGGNTWTRQGEGEIPYTELLRISAIDKNIAWAVGFHGTVLHTTDGGNTWEQQGVGTIPGVLLQGVYAVDHETVWVTGDTFEGYATIFHSTDGGNTWTRQGSAVEIPSNSHILGVSAADRNNAWVVGGIDYNHPSFVLHTADGGNTWVNQTPIDTNNGDANDVFAVNTNTAWMVQDHGGIFYTENGGENWTKQECNSSFWYLVGVSAIDANTAWVTGTGEATAGGKILHTTDGGDAWVPQTPPVNPNFGRVSFAPPTPPSVGGEAYPVNKISLLAPWIAVGVFLGGSISWYVLRRRKVQS